MFSVGAYHLEKKQLLDHLNGKECNEMKSTVIAQYFDI